MTTIVHTREGNIEAEAEAAAEAGSEMSCVGAPAASC